MHGISENSIARLPRAQITEEEDCIICTDPAEIGSTVTLLPCTHWFHTECITRWLQNHNTCPYCRSEVEGSPVERAPSEDEFWDEDSLEVEEDPFDDFETLGGRFDRTLSRLEELQMDIEEPRGYTRLDVRRSLAVIFGETVEECERLLIAMGEAYDLESEFHERQQQGFPSNIDDAMITEEQFEFTMGTARQALNHLRQRHRRFLARFPARARSRSPPFLHEERHPHDRERSRGIGDSTMTDIDSAASHQSLENAAQNGPNLDEHQSLSNDDNSPVYSPQTEEEHNVALELARIEPIRRRIPGYMSQLRRTGILAILRGIETRYRAWSDRLDGRTISASRRIQVACDFVEMLIDGRVEEHGYYPRTFHLNWMLVQALRMWGLEDEDTDFEISGLERDDPLSYDDEPSTPDSPLSPSGPSHRAS